jgi:excinuclease ABC subunit C
MREVLTRRLQRWVDSKEPAQPSAPGAASADGNSSSKPGRRKPGEKVDSSFATLPDLLIVDGGKGQLGVAVEVLESFGLLGRVPVAALAKQREEIFRPGRSESILLPRRSQALYLVQRIRDEAHRFALTSHRTRRAKVGIASQLDEIPGVGPARRKALLKHFGSLDAMRQASIEDMLAVRGITRAVAEAIKENL